MSTAPKTSSQEFALAAARLARETRCHSVVVLDVRGLSPITDFYVIATGTSARQMRSVSDQIAELAATSDHPTLGSSDDSGESWILLDCFHVLVHLFTPEARAYYDLDSLWGDAKVINAE